MVLTWPRVDVTEMTKTQLFDLCMRDQSRHLSPNASGTLALLTWAFGSPWKFLIVVCQPRHLASRMGICKWSHLCVLKVYWLHPKVGTEPPPLK